MRECDEKFGWFKTLKVLQKKTHLELFGPKIEVCQSTYLSDFDVHLSAFLHVLWFLSEHHSQRNLFTVLYLFLAQFDT